MRTATASPEDLDRDALLARVRELESLLKNTEARCAKLQYKLDDLLRRMFSPKSEKLNPAQRALFGLTELPVMLSAPQAPARRASAKGKRRGGRRAAPQNLPIHREVIDLPEEQKAGLVMIREEITEQIEYTPSQFYRRQIVRPVYASRARAHAPIVAALPPQVIPQAGVGPGFITHVLISKYVDHVPLYRKR